LDDTAVLLSGIGHHGASHHITDNKLSYRLDTGRQLCISLQLFSIAVITETYVRHV